MEPRRFTSLWAFTACYKDSFTLHFVYIYLKNKEYYNEIGSKIIFLKQSMRLGIVTFSYMRLLEFLVFLAKDIMKD
jgi:hypothetical protein